MQVIREACELECRGKLCIALIQDHQKRSLIFSENQNVLIQWKTITLNLGEMMRKFLFQLAHKFHKIHHRH